MLICQPTSSAVHVPRPAGPARTAPDWSQLPTEVLSCILQRVFLQHRLSSCAHVCTAWAAAAAASISSLSFESQAAGHSPAWWFACQARSAACKHTFARRHTTRRKDSGFYQMSPNPALVWTKYPLPLGDVSEQLHHFNDVNCILQIVHHVL